MPPESAKKLKKEEVEDDDDAYSPANKKKNKTKKKPSDNAAKPTKVKKEKQDDDDDDEEHSLEKKKPAAAKKLAKTPKKEERLSHSDSDVNHNPHISRNTPNKKDKEMNKKDGKKKKKKNGDEDATGTSTLQKRERKIYDLPGQKREPPEERDPLRIFYETLYQQVPSSEMASIWMMESGLLPAEEAKEVYERKLKKSRLSRISSPVKAVASRERSAKSVTVKKKVVRLSTKSPVEKKTGSTIESKKSTKRKKDESSEEEGSDEEFVMPKKSAKNQKAG
ncbi:hypothetical protein AKJ16_DCAP16617 [Drosera capensis]